MTATAAAARTMHRPMDAIAAMRSKFNYAVGGKLTPENRKKYIELTKNFRLLQPGEYTILNEALATGDAETINDLPPSESFYYDQALEDDANLPDDWFGSAFVSAAPGGSIAVVGNQFTGEHGLLTYQGFAEGHTEWIVPLYSSRLSNGYNSIIAIQNVSGSTIAQGDIDVAFTPDSSLAGATPSPQGGRRTLNGQRPRCNRAS